jgi:general secretion pathway protein K
MSRAAGSDGYVTLAVLVMAGLLAALVSTLIAVSRPSIDLTRLGGDEVAAEGLMQGGVAAAGYLLYPAARSVEQVDGLTLRFNHGSVDLAVADEGGRIDINNADPRLLAGLCKEVGCNSLAPDAFAARVADWRDEDEETIDGGAESGDYATAGVSYAPRNGPFGSVEELRWVLGLSRRDFNRLVPYVTVFTRVPSINPVNASRTVLRAVPDLSPQEIKTLLESRGAGEAGKEALYTVVESHPDFLAIEPTGVYRVALKAQLESGGYTDAAEAVLAAPPDESSDYSVVAWTKLPPTPGKL